MIAFSCFTPIHVMRAIQFHTTIEQFMGPTDIYINNCFKGSEMLAQRLKETRIFDNVVLVNQKALERRPLMFYIYGFVGEAKLFKQNCYNRIVSFSINSDQSNILYNINRKNPNFKFDILEDAPMLYDIPLFSNYKTVSINRLFGMKKACYNANYWWFSKPEMMHVPEQYGEIEKIKMPKMDITDKKLTNILNWVFNYEDDGDLDNIDILIMDESFYEDGVMIDNEDIRIYRNLKDNYTGFRFGIKMHPRTSENRYDGFLCLKNQHIPWELYVMNRLIEGKRPITQISITCSTMVSDKFLFDVENTKIFLAPLFCDKLWETIGKEKRNIISEETIYRIEKLKQSYRDRSTLQIVYSEDEINTIFKDIKRL